MIDIDNVQLLISKWVVHRCAGTQEMDCSSFSRPSFEPQRNSIDVVTQLSTHVITGQCAASGQGGRAGSSRTSTSESSSSLVCISASELPTTAARIIVPKMASCAAPRMASCSGSQQQNLNVLASKKKKTTCWHPEALHATLADASLQVRQGKLVMLGKPSLKHGMCEQSWKHTYAHPRLTTSVTDVNSGLRRV